MRILNYRSINQRKNITYKQLILKNSKHISMSRATNVLFIFQPEERLKKYLVDEVRTLKNIKMDFVEHSTKDQILKLAPYADIIVGWRPSDELLKVSRNLHLFINPGTGVQHLIFATSNSLPV